jgi:hypothetical protein
MASFTGVGDSVTLDLGSAGDVAAVAISGTYDMTIALEREQGSKGSGAWEEIKRWSEADATVAYEYTSKKPNESLRLIVLVDNSGTATATLTDSGDVLLDTIKDKDGNPVAKIWEGGGVTFPDSIIVLTDANATIKASDSGKTHIVPNVSADRTFTLPPAELGLYYRFVAMVGAADGHDWIFATDATDELFYGGVLMIDTDASPATAAAVVADQSNDDAFQVNLPQGGTVVEMYSNGAGWIVSGTVLSVTAAAFS